jgi:PhoPQ-activated pathogenicity-related protein
VRQWTAVSNTRDFRKAEWSSTPVHAKENDGRSFLADLAKPTKGFNAMFLEAEFAGAPLPFNLSTTLHVFGNNESPKSDGGAGKKY